MANELTKFCQVPKIVLKPSLLLLAGPRIRLWVPRNRRVFASLGSIKNLFHEDKYDIWHLLRRLFAA